MTHVMLDLETFGTGNDAVIVAIGAAKFDPNTLTRVDDSIYITIDPESCMNYGLKVDASTIMWWMHEDRAQPLRDWYATNRIDLGSALDAFAMWMGADLPVWGNGAAFDNVILRSAYKATGLTAPWSFYNDRCYRTMKNIGKGVEIKRVGTHHNAVDDSITQAQHLQDIVAHLGIAL